MLDAIVIGSGAGGLTTAVALARAGWKVLVLEQHYAPGGWCHSFTLEGYRFSPGVHYIGELGEGGTMRAMYEGLGVANDMEFMELNPDGYDHVMLGNERFDIPKGKEAYRERLKARFPREAAGIDTYLDAVGALPRELDRLLEIKGARDLVKLPTMAPTIMKYGWRTLGKVLDKLVDDPLLKGILSVQAGDHGLGPSKAPFPIHGVIQAHYFNGAWYPRGGAFTIPRAFMRELKRHGCELRLEARVDRILLDTSGGKGSARRAVGVRLADGTEIRAKHVISNADPAVTYGRLIGPEHLSWRLRRRLERTRYGVSALSLFMATDMDLAAAGMDSGNYWYNESADIEAMYRHTSRPGGSALGDFPGMFLTVTTLKDPTKKHKNGHHTMEAFTFVPFEPFARWQKSECGERPGDYEALKARLMGEMLPLVDRIVPGVSEQLVFKDLGTPLTNVHYCEATQGSLYGTEKTWRNIGPLAYQVRSEIPGLTLCGASTVAHGVAGATISGLHAAQRLLRCRISELLDPRGQHLRTYAAEDRTTWPEKLRKRAA